MKLKLLSVVYCCSCSLYIFIMSFVCDKCSNRYVHKQNLVRHQKKCDGKGSNMSLKIKCPECMGTFVNMNFLRNHIENIHKVQLETEKHRFETFSEFQKWKENVEKQTICWYVKKSYQIYKGEKRSYFFCHRSGYFISKSTGKRKLKSQGSDKIQSTCPSSMSVYENETGVYVTLCKTHFGHGSNIERCRLTQEERAMIAGKIAGGVDANKILDQI